jgi:hypothetical protein
MKGHRKNEIMKRGQRETKIKARPKQVKKEELKE